MNMTEQEYYEWELLQAGMVKCDKCKVYVHASQGEQRADGWFCNGCLGSVDPIEIWY